MSEAAWFRFVPAEAPDTVVTSAKKARPRLVCWYDVGHKRLTTEGEVRASLHWLRGEPYNTLMIDINGAPDKSRYPTDIGQELDEYEPVLRYLDKRLIENNAAMIRNGVNCLAVWSDEAKSMGLDFWIFFRLGAWGFAQPWGHFGGPFFDRHPEYRSYRRDGHRGNISYAFSEVRRYITDLYREAIQISRSQGGRCDGTVLGYSRGSPFLGYEPHVCEAFEKAYGIDPRMKDHPQWHKFRARYMTELLFEMRRMLDEESAKQGSRIKLVAESYRNETDNLRRGLDVQDWVERGLVDMVQVHTEYFSGSFDAAFYKRMGFLGKGKVEFVIGFVGGRKFDEFKAHLDDFDGLELSGPVGRTRGLDHVHPVRREGNLKLGQPISLDSHLAKPGVKTGQWPLDQLQGLPPGLGIPGL